MLKKKAKDKRVDVSGADVNDRGQLVNRDIPEDARRGAKKGKKRTDERKAKVEALKVDEEEGKKRKKRRRVDEDEVVEAPKKKKKRLRAIDGEASSKQLSRLQRRKEKTMAVIEMMPDSGGDEFDAQYRSMFQNLQHIGQLFEEKMMDNPTGRDVYALSTLYSQMREVIADIRSAKDVNQQIMELESKAYGSFMKIIMQTYVDLYFKLQKDIRTHVKSVEEQGQLLDTLQGAIKDQGDKAQLGYQAMLDRVRTVLM